MSERPPPRSVSLIATEGVGGTVTAGEGVVGEGEARGPGDPGAHDEVDDASSGVVDIGAPRVDVADAVAVGVGPAEAWARREIGADTFRDRQSRAFADQHHDDARAEQLTDRIADRDPAVATRP